MESPSESGRFWNKMQVNESMALVAELCRQFYKLGWVSGTGGAMSIKLHHLGLIIMTPSGALRSFFIFTYS